MRYTDKKWRGAFGVLLMCVATTGLFLACSEDGDNGTDPVDPISVTGHIRIRYDDSLIAVFVHGADVTADTIRPDSTQWDITVPLNASSVEEHLIVGAIVYNGGYTGGLMMNINTNVGLFTTDSTWKWMIDPPPGWSSPDYNDDAWYDVDNQGGADSVPTMVRDSACILGTDSCPMNDFIASGARFLWASDEMYFRKVFTVDTACSATVWAGCRGPHDIYIDGELVRSVEVADSSEGADLYLEAGEHTIAIFAGCSIPLINGSGNAMKAGIATPITIIQPLIDYWDNIGDTIGWDTTQALKPVLVCDSTWKVTPVQSAGWSGVGFDDAGWWDADVVKDQIYPDGYPGLQEFPTAAKTIWLPQTIAFRGKVKVQ